MNNYADQQRHVHKISIPFLIMSILASQIGLAAQQLHNGAKAAPIGQSEESLPSITAGAAFQRVWDRTDLPVAQGGAARSWLWGDQPVVASSDQEPYAEGPGGSRSVQYYDKSRMEVNNPSADPNAPWYVTNGLLVVEMMSGQIQVGDLFVREAKPAAIPVAGDTNDPAQTAPTYATLARVASLHGENTAARGLLGAPVTATIDGKGNVQAGGGPVNLAHMEVYAPQTGHNIPDVFWSFLTSKGTVNVGGQTKTDNLMDWIFVMGYPITEPYWTTIRVGGADRQVLVQAFQRRILTYSPGNPIGWQVEMGNVGLHYYDWRYGTPAIKLGQPTQEGYLLLEGKYVAPPYTVRVAGNGDVLINNQVVKAMPEADEIDTDSLKSVPTSPQTASDIVRFAEGKLRDMGQITDANRQQLIATLKALQAVASVQDYGSSIVVTDKKGERSGLFLDERQAQPVEEALAQQNALAAQYLTLLNSGGVLFFSTQGSSEVPGPNATPFLSGIIDAFNQPQAQRLGILTDLAGADSLARVLLAAGPPSQALRDRLSNIPRSAQPSLVTGHSLLSTQSSSVLSTHMMQLAANSRTPKTSTAYLFSIIGGLKYSDDTASVIKAVNDQTYDHVLYDRSTSTIDKFLETSGKAAVLYILAHGSPEYICPEQWRFEGDAKKAVTQYHDKGYSSVYEGAVESTSTANDFLYWTGKLKQYAVCIGFSDIAAHWKDSGTIIHSYGCSTFGLYGAFKSREYVAPDQTCYTNLPAKYNADFWGRIDGTKDGGNKRNVGDAYQATYAGTMFKLAGYGTGRTVLSPSVLSHAPTGSVQTGQLVQGTVTFDTPIRKDFPESLVTVVRLSGECAPQYGIPEDAKWQDPRTLSFTFRTKSAQISTTSPLTVTIRSDLIRSDDNIVPLDGNQVPANTNHVGPNHTGEKPKDYEYNDHFVWTVQCGPASGSGGQGSQGGQPTPTRVPPTPGGSGTQPTNTPRPTPPATPVPPRATPTPQSTGYFDRFHLQISEQPSNVTFYNVYSLNPQLDQELDQYTYNWQLYLPPGDDRSPASFQTEPGHPWHAYWQHNGNGLPGEMIRVTVQRGGQQVIMNGPATGPADVTPTPGP